MRILLTLEYDGTAYAGWQRQENALAVQQVVEEAVSRLVGERTVLFGASRTDAGVHALGQRAHFDTASRIPPDKYAYALNTMLPRDIRVRFSRAVADDFHARFSAVGKQYRYQIYSAPHAGALNRNTHAHVIYPLDAEKMRAELPALLGRHDFAAFAASGSVVKDTVRRITRAELPGDGPEYTLFIEGTGFLYNMVRIIAGTLIGVGTGKLEPGAFSRALISKSRLDLGATAHEGGDNAFRVHQGQWAPQAEAETANVHWHFVSLAIAIRIILLEGFENLLELVPCGWHLQAQLVEPGFVDEHVGCGHFVALATVRWQQRDLLACLHVLECAWVCVKECLDVWHVLEVWAEVGEVILVLGGIVAVEEAQADVRELRSSHFSALLLAPCVVGNLTPLDGALAGCLKLLGEARLLHRIISDVTANQDVDDWSTLGVGSWL